jgi:hypothetical protein
MLPPRSRAGRSHQPFGGYRGTSSPLLECAHPRGRDARSQAQRQAISFPMQPLRRAFVRVQADQSTVAMIAQGL